MSAPRILFCIFGLCFALLTRLSPALAQEEILSFESFIDIQESGELVVTETITVRAEGNQIRRGIFRDFPIRHRNENGFFHTVGFRVAEVLRNGEREPWFTERFGDYRRLYIGNADTLIDRGVHTYEIRYETDRQLGFFEGYDEIYWNVTGSRWAFPIRQAVVRIVLPEGASPLQVEAYTGILGATGTAFRIVEQAGRTVVIETTRVLAPGAGLTVAVGFTPGLIAAPSSIGENLRAAYDNLGFGLGIVGVIGLFLYYMTFWKQVGRDPEKGTVIPLFEPPQGFSPGVISFVHFKGFGARMRGASRAFVASLVSLAVKKKVDISERDGDITVTALDLSEERLPTGEKTIMRQMFHTQNQALTFNKSNGETLKRTATGYQSKIRKEYGERFYRENRGYFAAGMVLTVILAAITLFFYWPVDGEIAIIILLTLIAVMASIALAFGIDRVSAGWSGGFVTAFSGILIAFVGGALGGLLLLVTFAIQTPVQFILALAWVLAIFLNVLFFVLLTAPTQAGRKLMDDIEGFKMYLSVAEAERMNMAGAPDFSTDLFERYLPYAIGLGVEKPWSEALAAHLARAGIAESSYQPGFYHGSDWNSGNLTRSASAIGSSIGSSMTSAMPTPKSSSGSGGGGFSGGGGGGGGGGGW
ncbi:MAG: DUF2207 domain-containing protein [Hyphomicrobiales bacterium]|nr:DUF2207 domain-containing protein [Hyphomicrobiales bacterium]